MAFLNGLMASISQLYFTFLKLSWPLINIAYRLYIAAYIHHKWRFFSVIYALLHICGAYGLLWKAKGWLRLWTTIVLLESMILFYHASTTNSTLATYLGFFSILAFKDCELILAKKIKWIK